MVLHPCLVIDGRPRLIRGQRVEGDLWQLGDLVERVRHVLEDLCPVLMLPTEYIFQPCAVP